MPVPDPTAPWQGIDLRDALGRLPPEDATLLLLATAGGLSYQELAQIEGETIASVRSRLYRARHRLRAELFGSKDA